MLHESWGQWTQVNNHIMNSTLDTTNELGLLMRCSLIMHSSKNPFIGIIRHIALDGLEGDAVSFKIPLAPRSRKEASGIFYLFRINQEGSTQRRFDKIHGRISNWGMGTTN